jgi:hypothetical protein
MPVVGELAIIAGWPLNNARPSFIIHHSAFTIQAPHVR